MNEYLILYAASVHGFREEYVRASDPDQACTLLRSAVSLRTCSSVHIRACYLMREGSSC